MVSNVLADIFEADLALGVFKMVLSGFPKTYGSVFSHRSIGRMIY